MNVISSIINVPHFGPGNLLENTDLLKFGTKILLDGIRDTRSYKIRF